MTDTSQSPRPLPTRLLHRSALLIAGVIGCAGVSRAQDFDWKSGFGSGSPTHPISAFAVTDDPSGAGQLVYAAGAFTAIGGVRAARIARWDGIAWSALGDGLNSSFGGANAVEFFQGDLYVGGDFDAAGSPPASRLARWSSGAWSAVQGAFGEGVNGSVSALETFDDGSGPALYVAGVFTIAGGMPALNVARWDGSEWSSLGAGLNGACNALAVHDDGSGPKLYVGGRFTLSGATVVNSVARWDGTGWQPVGSGLGGEPGSVASFELYDDGSGERLIAGGSFNLASGAPHNYLAAWDGASWQPVGGGVGWPVRGLDVFDDGGGEQLYVGFYDIGSMPPADPVIRWNGSSWSTLTGISGRVRVIDHVDFGSHGGRKLLVGGECSVAAAPPNSPSDYARNALTWDASGWAPVAEPGSPPNATVLALEVYDDGAGSALYAAGEFTAVGDLTASRIARWSGASWSQLGQGLNGNVNALETYDDGGGARLFAGGAFTSAGGSPAAAIASWNGATWSVLGSGIPGQVYDMVVFDAGAGPELCVGGNFMTAGGVAARGVARWNGSSWSAFGAGLTGGVRALAVHDDGGGARLYAGGSFTASGATSLSRIARWTGSAWEGLGGGVDDTVWDLCSFDDGSGPTLYAGGLLKFADGILVNHLAKWRGGAWSAVAGSSLNQRVRALTVFDEGAGPHLYVGGWFSTPVLGLGRLEGSQLVALRQGVNGQVDALAEFDDGRSTRAALYPGGEFTCIGFSSTNLARWGNGSVPAPSSYCTAGTTSNGCSVTLSSSGEPRRGASDGFDVVGAAVDGGRTGLFFFGGLPHAAPWGSGTSFLCVSAVSARTSLQSSGGTPGACDGNFSLDFNAWMFEHPYGAPAVGAQVYMQAWFRDPQSSKGSSLSNGLAFEVGL